MRDLTLVYFFRVKPDLRAQFREELQNYPADVSAKYHLAYVLISQQKMQDAVPLLEEVIRLSPDYADAHYQMGRILLEQGNAAGAVERLETAVRLDP